MPVGRTCTARPEQGGPRRVSIDGRWPGGAPQAALVRAHLDGVGSIITVCVVTWWGGRVPQERNFGQEMAVSLFKESCASIHKLVTIWSRSAESLTETMKMPPGRPGPNLVPALPVSESGIVAKFLGEYVCS